MRRQGRAGGVDHHHVLVLFDPVLGDDPGTVLPLVLLGGGPSEIVATNLESIMLVRIDKKKDKEGEVHTST